MTDDELIKLHRGGHDRARSTTPTSAPSNTPAARPSSSPKPSRATASAALRRAMRRTRKRSSPTTPRRLCRAASIFRFPRNGRQQVDSMATDCGRAGNHLHAATAARNWAAIMPCREVPESTFKAPALDFFNEWMGGSKGRAVSTTMGFVSILRASAQGPRDRQTHRAHRSRRRPHLRHGIRHQAGRHLRARRPEVHPA